MQGVGKPIRRWKPSCARKRYSSATHPLRTMGGTASGGLTAPNAEKVSAGRNANAVRGQFRWQEPRPVIACSHQRLPATSDDPRQAGANVCRWHWERGASVEAQLAYLIATTCKRWTRNATTFSKNSVELSNCARRGNGFIDSNPAGDAGEDPAGNCPTLCCRADRGLSPALIMVPTDGATYCAARRTEPTERAIHTASCDGTYRTPEWNG